MIAGLACVTVALGMRTDLKPELSSSRPLATLDFATSNACLNALLL